MNEKNSKSTPQLNGEDELDNSVIEIFPYDIDIFVIIDEAKKKFPNDGLVRISTKVDNSTFFEMQEESVMKYFNNQGIDLSKEQKNRNYILPITNHFYGIYLGWKILTIDPNKIDALLCYQSAFFSKGNTPSRAFLELVEHSVYNMVNTIIPPNEDMRPVKIMDWLQRNRIFEIKDETGNIQNSKSPGGKHLLRIPTNATEKQILDFWAKLMGDNEKGEPYWESKQEIEHFVNQNFEGLEGVNEIKKFTPNMNKSELYQVTWSFYSKYKKSKTKKQYENLLIKNFTIFKDGKNVYSNIKDYCNVHLKELLK